MLFYLIFPICFQTKLSFCDLGDKDLCLYANASAKALVVSSIDSHQTPTVGIRAQIIAKLRVILVWKIIDGGYDFDFEDCSFGWDKLGYLEA